MKPTLFDWRATVRNPRLLAACPTLAQIPPEVLAAAWESVPNGTLPKTHLFALGIALAFQEITATVREQIAP